MNGMNFADTICIALGVALLLVHHDPFTAFGIGLLCFAIKPYHKS